jgi:ATP-dependent RNA helicase RhlE
MENEAKGFKDLKAGPSITKALSDLGINNPTPVQEMVIPRINAGHDVIAIAPTGTGKTAAYLIPLLTKLKFRQGVHPRALVLVPTRELSIQAEKMSLDLMKYMDLRVFAVYGGTGMKNQAETIGKGLDILIATPGRFLDLYSREIIHTKLLNTLVLDEADKMMDMGFLPQLHRILEVIPSRKRQNILLSATYPEKVARLADDFLNFPQKIEIEPQGSAAETIEQCFYKTPNLKTKINLLEFFLGDKEHFRKVIVFTKTKASANDVFKFIGRKIDQRVRVIHANKDQNARINAMNSFREGDTRILVSTDVTARGIDISHVSHVINFDVPVVLEDYVHRIGRTGRASVTGESITFVTPPDEYLLRDVEKITGSPIPEKKIPPEVEVAPTDPQERKKLARETDRIRRKTDPEYKGAFHPKKPKNRPNRSSGRSSK